MTDKELKLGIQNAIINFSKSPVEQASISLFKTLGYNTARQNPLLNKNYEDFKDSFLGADSPFNEERACVKNWKSIDLLFQLTADEVSSKKNHFNTKQVDNTIIETYLFFSIELSKAEYSRTQLAQITREINKVFPMPVLIVFKHGESITLSVINRRLNKKDAQKDVLEKVTVIKDISITSPHRAHIEIFFDLSFSELQRVHKFTNFVELHNAWQKTLDTKELNKRFYRDLSNWYFWALQEVHFPTTNWAADKNSLLKEEEKVKEHNAKNLIRLLTRLLFVWFVKEKNLIPNELFDESYIKENLLNGFEPRKNNGFDHKTLGSKYYRAILQNLFFATLNQTVGKREFRKDGQQMNVTNLMRYESYFKDPEAFIKLVEDVVPFMNGGLFECLDCPDPVLKGKKGGDVIIYEDGFSDKKDNTLCVPDYIFFGIGEQADLSQELGDKKQKDVTVSGLINILKSYKFTVTENTPIEEDIALDPELLGRVFENLLASYNPETKTTARKQTGSFYTPREIVNYMVDESLKAYLKQKLESEAGMLPEDAMVGLEFLVGYNEKENLFNDNQTAILINAINNCKILDPACGSGAYPMGILHKLVHILHKLDPNNKLWKERQVVKAQAIEDSEIRDKLIEDIETSFESNELDYGRKLYLIENCIYGVDIQPIATQISKLRFFISLIVDQKADKSKNNFGIRPLPNLETKFVAANTLIDIEKPKQQASLFDNPNVHALEIKLKDVRHRLFSAKTPKTKRELREKDQKIREDMGQLLEDAGWSNESARQLATWDPYNQNISCGWFDSEWMFGIEDGFDVVIGNPPYITLALGKNQTIFDQDEINTYKSLYPEVFEYKGNTFALFIKSSNELLTKQGILSLILPNTLLLNASFSKLRKYILDNFSRYKLLNFKNDVFESAVTGGNLVIVLEKGTFNKAACVSEIEKEQSLNSIEFNSIPVKLYEDDPSYNFVIDIQYIGIEDKIRSGSKLLGEIASFYNGIKTGDNKRFLSDRKINSEYYPVIRGRDIQKYQIQFGNIFVHFDTELLWSNTNQNNLLKNPKILIRQTGDSLIASLDTHPYMSMDTTHLIFDCKYDIKYVLSIINSKLVNWYYQRMVAEANRAFAEVKIVNIKKLPIKYSDNQKPFVSLVEKILSAKELNPTSDTSEFEKKIDDLVYKLYELTDEEIAVIEGPVR